MKKECVIKTGIEAFKFLAVGLPSFALAIPLNWLLVEKCGMMKTIAYALVLLAQVSVNFFLCRWLVFTPSTRKPIARQYAEFMAAVGVFRGVDWVAYSVLVAAFPNIHYIIFQIANVIVFSLAKFMFCKKAIEGGKEK